MPKDAPPSPPRKAPWAYALAAAAIWTLAAYDVIAPKPPPQVWKMAAAARACVP
jgi:hypothetical protein